MSWYYNYYLGYKEDGKIYALGPFDNALQLHSVFTKSRSFASPLYERFRRIREDEISDDLRKCFYLSDDIDDIEIPYLDVLEMSKLPDKSIVKSGYVLIEDVKRYEENEDADVFSEVISPTVYAAKLDHEMNFGKVKVDEGSIYPEYNASDYMFYVWIDYNSEEYESFLIRQAYNSLVGFDDEKREYFVLLTQG